MDAVSERTFIPVPPDQRPVRRRHAARVIVRSQGKMLLELDTDPGTPGSGWWVTPGGGVDGDETYKQAAVRELLEETGLRIDEDDLIGPIAHQYVRHGYSDEILEQDEQIFAANVAMFTPQPAGFTEAELVTMAGFAWMDADDMRADPHAELSITPEWMERFMAAGPGDFWEIGDVEVSTVPLRGPGRHGQPQPDPVN
jgi:8-oxo-dGTP pyrophosphatase MutT (NUDIX family)